MAFQKLSGLALFICFLFFGSIVAEDTIVTANDSSKTTASDTARHDTQTKVAPSAPSHGSENDIVYTPVGYGSVEVGQVASGHYRRAGQSLEQISHVWQQRAFGQLGYIARIKNRLEIDIRGEGMIAFSTPQTGTFPQTLQTRYFFYPKSAFASCLFGDPEYISFKAQAGYFQYKYSPYVRNLGENLFRTNAYPLLVYSDFDYPLADILGLRVNFQYLSPSKILRLQNDLLLHSELYSVPVKDWSLSDVFSVKLFDAFTVGGGVSFANLFSVYQGEYGGSWTDPNFNPDKFKLYLKNGTDSALFDWKSIKIMQRLSFDPKRFIPVDIFGKNDLILYSETDIIGIRNYPQYYTNVNDRIFYSVGFNFPGFKIIDVINGEIEYCSDTSAFSDEGLSGTLTPRISPSYLNASGPTQVKRSPWRLSLYVKKSFYNGRVSVIGQCARDHKKLNYYYFDRGYMSFMETLPASADWWWTFKTEFCF